MHLVERAGKLDLIALAPNDDVLQREAGRIEEVADIAEISVYDAFPYYQDERIGIVEGGAISVFVRNISPRSRRI